jgi:hypothetical protein
MIASAMLMAIFGSSGFAPSVLSPAFAQSGEPRQFAVVIKQRKVTLATDVIELKKGDTVEIVLTADEPAELHLHGYDLLLTLSANVPGKMQFTANIAGRFPLEAHRFGDPAQGGRSHGQRPLLYVEVQPR